MNEQQPLRFPMRLNRYIAACGVTSRRKADELIAAGRVEVDGQVEDSLGRVLTGSESVCLDGKPLEPQRSVYIAINKPKGVLCAVSDARESTILDLLPPFYRPLGLFPVGRLDKNSEGLLFLTNDGEFAQKIMHPSFGVRRTYDVTLAVKMEKKLMDEWRSGVIIGERMVKPLDLHPHEGGEGSRRFTVVLSEGFKREIRLMAEALGNRVIRLQRIGIGKLFLKKLPLGAFNEYNCEAIWDMIMNGGEV